MGNLCRPGEAEMIDPTVPQEILIVGVLVLLVVAFVVAMPARRRRVGRRGAWEGMDLHNLGHRQLAISVRPWPDGSRHPTWTSYRQRNPSAFRHRKGRMFPVASRKVYSRRYGTTLWIIRGRLKSNGKWATQTVREKIRGR